MVALAPSVLEKISGKNVIIFDGECVLCSAFFKFVYKHDDGRWFHFVIAQSDLGEALYDHYGLKAEDYETSLVILNGVLHQRLHGFFEVVKFFGFPWNMLTVFKILPNWLLDWAYYRIARNRYRLFGKFETCMVPDEKIKGRFLD